MKVKVIDERGWYLHGFNPCGSIVECSESVFTEASKSVKLEKVKKNETKPDNKRVFESD